MEKGEKIEKIINKAEKWDKKDISFSINLCSVLKRYEALINKINSQSEKSAKDLQDILHSIRYEHSEFSDKDWNSLYQLSKKIPAIKIAMTEKESEVPKQYIEKITDDILKEKDLKQKRTAVFNLLKGNNIDHSRMDDKLYENIREDVIGYFNDLLNKDIYECDFGDDMLLKLSALQLPLSPNANFIPMLWFVKDEKKAEEFLHIPELKDGIPECVSGSFAGNPNLSDAFRDKMLEYGIPYTYSYRSLTDKMKKEIYESVADAVFGYDITPTTKGKRIDYMRDDRATISKKRTYENAQEYLRLFFIFGKRLSPALELDLYYRYQSIGAKVSGNVVLEEFLKTVKNRDVIRLALKENAGYRRAVLQNPNAEKNVLKEYEKKSTKEMITNGKLKGNDRDIYKNIIKQIPLSNDFYQFMKEINSDMNETEKSKTPVITRYPSSFYIDMSHLSTDVAVSPYTPKDVRDFFIKNGTIVELLWSVINEEADKHGMQKELDEYRKNRVEKGEVALPEQLIEPVIRHLKEIKEVKDDDVKNNLSYCIQKLSERLTDIQVQKTENVKEYSDSLLKNSIDEYIKQLRTFTNNEADIVEKAPDIIDKIYDCCMELDDRIQKQIGKERETEYHSPVL